ncbi:MAG: dephospho-CoA kinase [Lachnospiraceae bacterium]|nr:dephospho-CoA kinase [Lachnospiraceae bacterium]
MKIIGITGGVGAGKSEVLKLIRDMVGCIIVTADDLARSLEVKGEVCYEPLVKLLGEQVLSDDGQIDPKKMAQMIFAEGSEELLKQVNAIVHPAVKERITAMIADAEDQGAVDYFFIEAALLIEDGYDKIVDELWYVWADEDTRRMRLKDSRGYSDEKTDDIMDSQSSDDVFRRYCRVVIDNSCGLDDTKKQLEKLLG